MTEPIIVTRTVFRNHIIIAGSRDDAHIQVDVPRFAPDAEARAERLTKAIETLLSDASTIISARATMVVRIT